MNYYKNRLKRRWAAEKAWLAKPGSTRDVIYAAGTGIFVASVVLLNILVIPRVHAGTPYTASNELGQSDSSHTSPSFTSNNTNNVPQINKIGLNSPQRVALDSVHHRLFVADYYDARVLVYNLDANNHFTSQSADNALGQSGFASNTPNVPTNEQEGITNFGQADLWGCAGPSPAANTICGATGLAYDSVNNRLFVSDSRNNRVLDFDLSGGITDGMAAVHELGQADLTSNPDLNCSYGSTTASSTTMCNPGGLAYDEGSGTLFVADSNDARVMIYDLSGGITDGMAAVHELGEPDMNTSPGPLGVFPTDSLMNGAEDVAYDSVHQYLYVADGGEFGDNRVVLYNLSGGITDGMAGSHFLGQGSWNTIGCGGGSTGMCSPEGLNYDSGSGTLFVSDAGNNRILTFDTTGGIIDQQPAVHVLGQADMNSNVNGNCGSEPYTAQNHICDPEGLAYDAVNAQLFAIGTGENRAVTYDLSGGITDGQNASHEVGQTDYTGADNYTLSAANDQNPGPYGLNNPSTMALDTVHHRLFVTDYRNQRVLVFNTGSNGVPLDRTADFVIGQPNFTTRDPNCDHPGITQATFCKPTDISYDSVHNRLFVSDTNRILVFDLSGGITNGMNASHVIGQSNFTSSGCQAISASSFCGIYEFSIAHEFMTYDSADDYLFVTDTVNNRVLAFDLSGGITDGMDASWVIGQQDFVSGSDYQGGSVSATGLSSPLALAFDNTNDRLFVADNNAGRVLVYNIGNGISSGMAANNVLGPSDFTSNGGLHPFPMSFDDASQTLFGVVNQGDNTNPFEFTMIHLAGGITDGMNGNFRFIASCDHQLINPGFYLGTLINNGCLKTEVFTGGPAQDAFLFNPATGQAMISDPYDNRVMFFDITPTILTNGFPSGTVGTPYSQTIDYEDVFGSPIFTVATGSLPAGLTLNASTGEISGTPTTPQNPFFGILLTDSLTGQTAFRVFNIPIGAVLPPPPGPGYLASGVIGQPDFTSNAPGYQVPGSSAQYPSGSAIDPVNHLLFIADTYGSRVLVYRLNSDNTPNSGVAISVIGQPDFTHLDCNQDGSSTADTLCSPGELVLDSVNHRLIVTDSSNNRVLFYNLNADNTPVDGTADYELGQPDFTTADCVASAEGECFPSGVTLDSTNHHLYITDSSNSRVLGYDLNSDNTPVDGTADYVIGEPDFDTVACNTTADSLCYPYSQIAIDSTNHELYVVDAQNARVVIYNLDSDNTPVDGTADYELGEPDFDSDNCGTSADDLCAPDGMVLDAANHHLFVAEYANSRIVEYNLNSSNVPLNGTADYVFGQADFDSSDCNDLCGVQTITLDTVDHRLIAGGQNVTSYVDFYNLNSSNVPADDTVDYTLQPADSVSGASGLSDPSSTVLDSVHHRLFVGDSVDSRVLVYNLDSNNNLTSPLAAYVLGQPSFTSDNCNLDQSSFCDYIPGSEGDTLDDIGLAYDSTGNRLFVSDGANSRVMVFDLAGGITNGMDASNVLGEPDFTTNNNPDGECINIISQTSLCTPGGLTYDSAGQRLFVSDSGAGRVMVFDLAGGITDGMPAAHELGQADFESEANCNPSGQAIACIPVSLDYDSANQRLFVSDTYRVLIFDLAGGITDGMSASYELGRPDFNSFDCPYGDVAANQNSLFCYVGAVAYNPQQQTLLVSDTNRVMIFDVNPATVANDENASAVLGQADFTGNNSATTQSNLTYGAAEGMSYDPVNHRLFLPDSGNNRVLIYNFARITTTSMAGGAVGSAYSQAIDETGSQGTIGYTLQGGSLPPGVVLAADTGTLSGTPTTAGTYTFSLGLADNNGVIGTFIDNKAFSLTVAGAGSPPPTTPPTTPPSTPPTTPPTTPPVDLDNNPPATTPNVCSGVTSASAGQIFSFTAADGTKHTITVLQVGADSVVLQVDNLPKTLHVGDLISQDINGDGTPDICVDILNISNGIVQLDIARIILSISPGAQISGPKTPAAKPPAAHKAHSWSILKFIFPWLLFILLGSTFMRLVYLSYQQRRLAVALNAQLAAVKALSEEKQNFMTLSAHYLRTPMTLISNGIDLMASVKGNSADIDDLRIFSQQLNLSVNNLLITSSAQPPVVEGAQPSGLMAKLQPLSAGFAQVGASALIAIALVVSVIIVVLSNYILSRVDLQNMNLILVMTELAGLLFLGVLMFSALRSYNQRKELRTRVELQLEQQKALDKNRDGLMERALETLKTPLEQLKTKMQPIAAADPKMAQPIVEGISRLENLVGKFTILNSLKSSTMGTQNQSVDLGQLLNQSSQHYADTLKERGLSIDNQLKVTQLQQDPLLTSFILESLLNNAIKYSPPNQQIKVSSHKRGKQVWIEVKDNGPGIPQDKLNQLFQPFSRAENAAEDFDQKGIGLSLYLDKIITQYLGGSINMRSGSSGTTASFSLPAGT